MKIFKPTLCVYLLLITSLLAGQQVKIDWSGSYTLKSSTNTDKQFPFFKNQPNTNQHYSLHQEIPYLFGKQNASAEDNLQISNLVWKEIGPEKLLDVKPEYLPSSDEASIYSQYDRFAQAYFTYYSVATLKRKGNQFFQLESFLIEKNTQSRANKNTNRLFNYYGSTQNPLVQGDFYKIKVDKTGVFKITSQFLRENGINPQNIDPRNFRIYGNGGLALPEMNTAGRYAALQENAIEMIGANDGVWNEGDYALFYAQGPHGYNLHNPNNGHGNKRPDHRTERSENFVNIYEDFAYYFINFDKGPGKRIITDNTPLPNSALIKKFDRYYYSNIDKTNPLHIGRLWVDDPLQPSRTFNLSANGIALSDTITYRYLAYSINAFGNKVSFKINQNLLDESIVVNNSISRSGTFGNLINTVPNLSELNVSIDLNNNVRPDGTTYLDYFEVQFKDQLKYNGGQFNFRYFDITEGNLGSFGFELDNAAGVERLWDVSDITNVKQKNNLSSSTTSYQFAYVANSDFFNNEFVAFNLGSVFSPSFVGRIPNQDLSSLSNVDYLIITIPEFFSEAERMAQYHRTKNNFNVKIVSVYDIYNEFSSGGQDITAIRDFTTKLNQPNGTLKFVLILGDTSYDYKNRTPNNSNIIPAYQSEFSFNYESSFVTDEYFANTEPQQNVSVASVLPDIPIGRLIAANISEAKNLVDKALSYYNALPGQSTPFGDWRMKMHFIADDDIDGGAPFNTRVNDALITEFENNTTKPEYNIRKLYMDAFLAQNTPAGQRFPQVTDAIKNAMSNSVYLNYFGHGGINGWAQERIITPTEISQYDNKNTLFTRFPLITTLTCEFTLWDDPGAFSAGEIMVKSTKGGSACMVTSCRAIGVIYGLDILPILLKHTMKITNDEFDFHGISLLKTKREYGISPDHSKINYLGDPALKIVRPKKLISVESIQSPIVGQIRALDFIKIKGHINKPDGTLDVSFNGKIVVNIFDKRIQKQTLNNDGNVLPILHYTEEGNAIVRTTGRVINGEFLVEFYVPKDINYQVGIGRLLLYADNGQKDVYTNQSINVGGINPNGINDNLPPKVRLYMNNTNFANGGITNQNPILLACVSDDTGINSSGAGVGHDITAYIDGDIVNTYTLNEFYITGDDFGCSSPSLSDYQKGSVNFQLRNLPPGEHTITFKIWDINNNSTTETLNFVVRDESSQNLQINRLMNWPNPFTHKTYLHFEHNCPDILAVDVQIFTLTGKLVRSFQGNISSEPFREGFRTGKYDLEWDGRDDYGDLVGKGTYIYKVFVKSMNPENCKGTASAYEKMLILK